MADAPKTPGLIVSLNDIYAMRERRENELKFYRAEREKLEAKMAMVAHELDLTDTIIRMIENDQIQDLKNLSK
jgi:hypothetical protein